LTTAQSGYQEELQRNENGEGFDLRPSVYGRTTDALASRGDEGRGQLR